MWLDGMNTPSSGPASVGFPTNGDHIFSLALTSGKPARLLDTPVKSATWTDEASALHPRRPLSPSQERAVKRASLWEEKTPTCRARCVGSPPSRSFKLLDQLGFDETDFVPLTEGRQTRRRPVLKRSEIDHKRLALVQRKASLLPRKLTVEEEVDEQRTLGSAMACVPSISLENNARISTRLAPTSPPSPVRRVRDFTESHISCRDAGGPCSWDAVLACEDTIENNVLNEPMRPTVIATRKGNGPRPVLDLDAPSTYKRDRIALLMREAGLTIPPRETGRSIPRATWSVAVMEMCHTE